MGDTAVLERTAADHRLELKLKFESRDYTLPQLRRRLQDVEALLIVLLADRTLLPLSSGKRAITYRPRTRRYVNDQALVQEQQAELLKGVTIEKVSLSSPLEILAVVTASASAVAAVIKLMPRIIAIKNEWNESRVQRAESNLKIDRIMLERKLVKVLSDETDKLSETRYLEAGPSNPTKKLVKAAARAIGQLDDAETKD
ncbi:hypothetical protein A6A22_10920 [Arthrobacter sp. OY3WO11]|nr:hypothetical protein A6A22_10920 [Arthrobacter sp. OY3WO11]